MVEHKIFCIETKWKETNLFVTSSTGEGICNKSDNERTWREVVTKQCKYYYDLEDVYDNRTAYSLKAMSAGVTSMSYAPIIAAASSNSNGDDDDGKEGIDGNVSEDIRANLDADGLYNTPTGQLRLRSKT